MYPPKIICGNEKDSFLSRNRKYDQVYLWEWDRGIETKGTKKGDDVTVMGKKKKINLKSTSIEIESTRSKKIKNTE